MGKVEKHPGTDSVKINWVVLYQSAKEPDSKEQQKVKQWLYERLKTEHVLLIRENNTAANK